MNLLFCKKIDIIKPQDFQNTERKLGNFGLENKISDNKNSLRTYRRFNNLNFKKNLRQRNNIDIQVIYHLYI